MVRYEIILNIFNSNRAIEYGATRTIYFDYLFLQEQGGGVTAIDHDNLTYSGSLGLISIGHPPTSIFLAKNFAGIRSLVPVHP